MPAAATLISTSPAPGRGTGRVPSFITSGGPKPSNSMHGMVEGNAIW